MKKYFIITLFFVVAIACGTITQMLCYRFPSIQEMKDYHEGHYTTEVISMVEEPAESNCEVLLFRARHTNGQGFTEAYKVQTGKAWVLPWETYWESRARMKDKKK